MKIIRSETLKLIAANHYVIVVKLIEFIAANIASLATKIATCKILGEFYFDEEKIGFLKNTGMTLALSSTNG